MFKHQQFETEAERFISNELFRRVFPVTGSHGLVDIQILLRWPKSQKLLVQHAVQLLSLCQLDSSQKVLILSEVEVT